ncbi:SPW repeat protein [Patulibacter sp. SYSU D01012]|uniref:SPW repeat domain-containing protein n=1 Tax=Patulibacter sp. SYSU D01012 TaxID=2817381 RepID=UPI001B30C3E2|nr:SPW repeat protein [Patulibacter sp. SYSU D01012]
MRPIPVSLHATAEPFIAIVLIAFPWILGYDDNDAATIVSVAAGVVTLLVGGSTKWRQSLVKLIPLRTHAMLDVGVGVVLVVAPFVFGYTEETGAMAFHIVIGLGEIMVGVMTNWRTEDEVSRARPEAGISSRLR